MLLSHLQDFASGDSLTLKTLETSTKKGLLQLLLLLEVHCRTLRGRSFSCWPAPQTQQHIKRRHRNAGISQFIKGTWCSCTAQLSLVWGGPAGTEPLTQVWFVCFLLDWLRMGTGVDTRPMQLYVMKQLLQMCIVSVDQCKVERFRNWWTPQTAQCWIWTGCAYLPLA